MARRHGLVGPVATALCRILVDVSHSADLHLLALHIEPEHVHLLVSLRPDQAVASAVQRLKGGSARQLRQRFPHLGTLHSTSIWTAGYFVRSLGELSVAQAKAYLDRQAAHHNEDQDS